MKNKYDNIEITRRYENDCKHKSEIKLPIYYD